LWTRVPEFDDQSHDSLLYPAGTENEDNQVYKKSSILIVNPGSELNGQSYDSLLYPAGTENENNQVYKKSSILIVNPGSELNCHMIHSCIRER
jgi:hypothetical protein